MAFMVHIRLVQDELKKAYKEKLTNLVTKSIVIDTMSTLMPRSVIFSIDVATIRDTFI